MIASHLPAFPAFILVSVLALAASTTPAQNAPQRRPLSQQDPPPGTRVLRDIEYTPGGGRSRSLDLYLPENNSAGPLPLIVWIHGGAWRAGSKERPQGLALLRDGFAIASINYRLTQEAVFPAQIIDCKAAIRFLRAHAAEHGIDPDRIGVFGASAGGHLAALLGMTADLKEWDQGAHRDQSSRVQAVCNWFGPAELLTMRAQSKPGAPIEHDAPDSPESRLIGGAVQKLRDKARAASPITYASADDSPILHVHGDRDPLVPVEQSIALHAALEKAGAPSQLHIVKGGGHGQGFATREIRDLVRDFFLKHLGQRSPR
jgi:acetyl esterase/lipase